MPGIVEATLDVVGSLAAEELKGDFAAARAAILTHPQSDPPDALLATGIVAALQGEHGLASASLDAALADLRGAHAQLAASLRALVSVGELPGGASIDAFELARRAAGPTPEPCDPGERVQIARLVDVLAQLPARRQKVDAGGRSTSRQALDDAVPVLEAAAQAGFSFFGLAAADLYRRAGQPEQARERLAAALAASEEAADPAGVGLCHLVDGDWRAARLSSPPALDFMLCESHTESSELTWSDEVREFAPGADLAGAREAYAKARPLFRCAGAPRALAALTLREAYLAFRSGDAETARRAAARARARFAAAGDSRGAWLAAAHGALADIAAGAEPDEETAAAIGAWGAGDGAFAHALGIGLLFGRAARHWQLRAGDAERALAANRLAAALFETLGAEANVLQTMVDRAIVHRQIGDWSTASLVFGQALERGAGTVGGTAKHRLTWLLRRWGVAVRQVSLAAAAGDYVALEAAAPVFTDLAPKLERLRAKISDPDQTQMLSAAQAVTGGWLAQIPVLAPLHRALEAERFRQLDDVQKYKDQALTAARGLGLLEAIVLDTFGRSGEARQVYLASIESGADELPTPAAPELDQLENAVRLHTQLAMLARLEAWPEAAKRLEELDSVLPAWPETLEIPWTGLDDRGQVLEHTRALEPALGAYDAAIAALESRRERLSLDALRVAQTQERSASRPFMHAARAALKAADKEADPATALDLRRRAFGYIERGKARALIDLMGANADLARGKDARHWREVGARLNLERGLLAASPKDADEALTSDLERRVRDDEAELDRVEAALAAADPRWRETVSPVAPPLELEEVVQRLGSDTLLLQYQFQDGDLIAWALDRDGIAKVVRERRDTKALSFEIADFASACHDGGEWEGHAARLDEVLLAPFAGQLEDYEKVICVPSGLAHRLPFSAMPRLAAHTLSVLPSASALAFLDDEPLPLGPLLALGDPQRMTYQPLGDAAPVDWTPLPWSRPSAAFAASLFPGSGLLLRTDATEEKLEDCVGQFPLLLLDTHAELRDAPPGAYLVLHRGGLELYELLGLDLRATKLAVLAACNTAVGSITGGDEVMALTRGLLAAGAGRAVVTLWKTHAHSQPLFLRAFFLRLQAKEAPAAALRGAQNDVKGLDEETAREQRAEMIAAAIDAGLKRPREKPRPLDWKHPRHWAPYVLVGR